MPGIEPARRRILVVGPLMHGHGHLATFPRDLACGFSLNGCEVTLLFCRPRQPNISLLGMPVREICLHDHAKTLPLWKRILLGPINTKPILACMAWLVFFTPSTQYDLVYWSDVRDSRRRYIGLLGLLRASRLYRHRTAFTEHQGLPWRRYGLCRHLRIACVPIHAGPMFVHSEALLHKIRKVLNAPEYGYYLPWGLWPEPLAPNHRQLARARLALPPHRRVLLVFGWQSVHRKRLHVLYDVLTTVSPIQPITVLFVGKHKSDERHPFLDFSAQAEGSVEVRFVQEYVSEKESKDYFSAADAIWANYEAFEGASGVLLQAISHGRLVIYSDSGEIGSIGRRFNLGLAVEAGSALSLERVIRHFSVLPHDEQMGYESNARTACERFEWQSITGRILERLGMKGCPREV